MRSAYRRIGPPAAAMCLLLAGCAATAPTAVVPELEPIVVEARPLPVPPPPAPAPQPPPPPEAPRFDIALVVDAGAPAHAGVADEIEAALPPRQYRITRITTDAAAADLEALRSRRVTTVVAVGPQAVLAARAALPDTPLVFCQVPSYDDALQAGSPTWGVETLPPLALQLKTWRSVDPSLRTVALIVSASGAALADEARRAASSLATDLLVETSASDRETLYLFRRLAAAVDGLWLLPDNVALSPAILRELLSLASTRGIGVLTFNEALLARGALLTAMAVPADVAETVAQVVDRVVAGRTADLSPMTPLRAAALAVNADVATALGLPPIAATRWVARDPD